MAKMVTKTKKAGCVPVRKRPSGEWEVLLVKGFVTAGRWTFPRGTVEENEKPKLTATRETEEEAGVRGIVGPKLGRFEKSKKNPKGNLVFYLLYVQQELVEYMEVNKREKTWFTLAEAKDLFVDMHRRSDCRALDLLKALHQTMKILEFYSAIHAHV